MAGISGSSIQPWLDFQLVGSDFMTESIPATIPSCQNVLPESPHNCAQICNSSLLLAYEGAPNNLLTCGLWATLIVLDSSAVMHKWLDVHARYQDVLGRFVTVGLDAADEAFASATIEAVSTALSTLLQENRHWTYQSDSVLGTCSQQYLFPSTERQYYIDIPQRVRNCVTEIYAPKSLNPDLGGIGVSIKESTRIHEICKLISRKGIYVSLDTAWNRHCYSYRTSLVHRATFTK